METRIHLCRRLEVHWDGERALPGNQGRLLFAYLVLFLAWQLMPLDLSLSPVELYRKWRDGRVLLLPFSSLPPGVFDAGWQIGADLLLKATKVDGVYSADPKLDPKAEFLPEVTYDRVLKDRLKVMDMTAFALCREQKLPVIIFDMKKAGNIAAVAGGKRVGTKVVI